MHIAGSLNLIINTRELKCAYKQDNTCVGKKNGIQRQSCREIWIWPRLLKGNLCYGKWNNGHAFSSESEDSHYLVGNSSGGLIFVKDSRLYYNDKV